MTRHALAPGVLAIVLVAAACGLSVPLASPSASDSPSSVATAPGREPTPGATPIPSPPMASPSQSSPPPSQAAQPSTTRMPRTVGAAVPADWTVFDWRDAEAGIALPPGWTTMDMDEIMATTEDDLATASPHDAAIIDAWRRLHAVGADRLAAYGLVPGSNDRSVSVSVVIETGDTSQADLVSRLIDEDRTILGATDPTTRELSTAVGPATELRYTFAFQGMTQSPIDLAVFLPSRRSLTVSIQTFDDADAIDPFVASIAATIHESREPRFTFAPSPAVDDVGAYIAEAVRRLEDLASYRFVAASDRQHTALTYRGTLERSEGLKVDGILGLFMGESDGAAGISSAQEIVISEDRIWATGSDGRLDMVPNEGETGAFLSAILPEAVLGQYVVPYAGDYERVGTVDHNGVRAVHFRLTAAGATRYARAIDFAGKFSADVWVAETGDYLAGAVIDGVGEPVTSGDRTITPEFHVEVTITNANDPINVVDLPD